MDVVCCVAVAGEAKKGDYRALSAALPSRKAWQDEWTKPGAEGGMGGVGSRKLVGLEGLRPET